MSGGPCDADDNLEDYFDAIVLSTGLSSSILAAALAKAGKSVLYLDCHEYYGQDSASFSFTQLLDWARENGSCSSGVKGAGNADDGGKDAGGGGALEGKSCVDDSPAVASASAAAAAVTAGQASFDSVGAGAAIARAHVRNELKREKRDAAAAAAALEEATASKNAESAGCTSSGDSNSGCAVGEGEGGDPAPGEDGERRGDMEQGSEAAAPATAAVDAGQDSNGNTPPAQEQQQQPHRRERERREEGEGKEPTAEEKAAEKAAEDAAAAERLRSLDLTLLPLAYHGCATRAGAPSDACVSERRRRKAAEDAAAATGRFLGKRQPQPSHPAWAGRREPTKAEGEERGERSRGVEAGAGGEGGAAAAAATAGEGGGAEERVHPSFLGYRTERRPCAADLVRLSRSFNLDLTSKVMLSTGPAVDALVDSGVSRYLEFKDMQALYLASDLPADGRKKRRQHGEGEARSAAPTNGGGRDRGSTGGNGDGNPPGSVASTSAKMTVAAAAAPPAAKRSTATIPPPSTMGLGLSRVPCSKADVFGTRLLTPLEKRRLMKFLLFASDWGIQRAGEDVLARNEAGLGKGRSLRRPQNRETASGDFGAEAYAGKPFAEFLKSCGLPERVRAMITHALALLPGGGDGGGEAGLREEGGGGGLPGVTTEEGLEAVCRHISALGRFGETAFITPMYGVGELSQSFCRMAAVHGAICILRRQLTGAVIDRVSGRCVGVVDDAGRAFACSTLVVGGEFFALSPGTTFGINASPKNEEERLRQPLSPTTTAAKATTPTTPTSSALQSQAPSPPPPSSTSPLSPSPPPPPPAPAPETRPDGTPGRVRSRLLRRVVIASGPVAPEGRGRGLCVLPPGLESVGNPAAVHVVSLDESTAACPGNLDGACVIHLTTTAVGGSAPTDVFEGGRAVGGGTEAGEKKAGTTAAAGVEAGAAAAGELEGAGAVNGGSGGVSVDENGKEGVLGRAARELLSAAGVDEIWSLGFSWDIQDPPSAEDLPSNMVVCERLGQELYQHDVVVQAERAFARLCPGKPFWPTAVGDEENEEDDDQAEMLRAAASAVTSAAATPPSTATVAADVAASDAEEGREEGGEEEEGLVER
ncbi:unnamed protein product [Scytosiphon promiscuus]